LARDWGTRALGLGHRAVAEAAVETGLIVGCPGAWERCQELATSDIPGSAPLLLLVAILGSPREQKILLDALARKDRRRDVLWALGFGGRRAGADACIELMARDEVAGVAGEAFCAITGLDLKVAGLVVAAPERRGSADDDDHQDDRDDDDDDEERADVASEPRAEDQLPLPDVAGLRRWWDRERAGFDPEARYIGGRRATFAVLHDALANGPMRRRHALALELAIRTEGRLQVQTRAFVPDQRRRLAAFAALPREAFDGRFAREMERPGRRSGSGIS
jgi:uncharacterized protein (TIGR02270 family)